MPQEEKAAEQETEATALSVPDDAASEEAPTPAAENVPAEETPAEEPPAEPDEEEEDEEKLWKSLQSIEERLNQLQAQVNQLQKSPRRKSPSKNAPPPDVEVDRAVKVATEPRPERAVAPKPLLRKKARPKKRLPLRRGNAAAK